MAFPSVRSSNSGTTVATSHTIPMPGTIVAGDLLVIVGMRNIDTGTTTPPSGWTSFGTGVPFVAYRKVAAGSDTATLTTSVTVGIAWTTISVQDWSGDINDFSNVSTADNNPTNNTPTWGAADDLWVEAFGSRGGTLPTVTVWSTNYTQIAQVTGDFATDVHAGMASRQLNATAENPDAITVTGSPTGQASRFFTIRPAGIVVAPAVDAVTVTLPTPAVLAASLVAPAVLPVTVSLPTPIVAIAATVTPAVIPVTVTLPTPTVQAASKVTPAVIPVTVSLPTPTTLAAAVVTPAVIAVTVSLPTPTVLAAAKVLPAVIPVTLTLPTPTIEVSEASTVTPATIAVSVSLLTPTITSAMVVTPAGIALVVTVPTPLTTTPGLVTPAGISLVVTLPTASTVVGAMVGAPRRQEGSLIVTREEGSFT